MTARKQPRRLTHLAHRRVIGFLGLALPVLVLVISAALPARVESGGRFLDSMSAYYYTSATALLVGTLFALAMFLFVYGGYEGDSADRHLGKLAGLAALGVAFFPTAAPSGFAVPSWWADWMRPVHYSSATALFVAFILFSLWLFRKSAATSPENMSQGKRRRNRVYLWCGVVMIVTIGWAGTSYWTHKPIFVPEAIALIAFAVSWLTKGRSLRWVKQLRQTSNTTEEAA